MAKRESKLLSTRDAAKRLGVIEQLVRRWCGQGRLGLKVGLTWVIPADELERFDRGRRKIRRGRSVKV